MLSFFFLSFLKTQCVPSLGAARAASATLSSSRSPSPIEAGGSRRARGGRSRVRAPLSRREPPRRSVRPAPTRVRAPWPVGATMLTHAAALAGRARPGARPLLCTGSGAAGRRLHPPASALRRSSRPASAAVPGRRERAACARGALRRGSRSLPLASAAPAGPPRTHTLRGRARPARDPGAMHEPVRRALGPGWGEISREWSGFFFFGHAPWGPRAPPRLPQLVPGAVTSRRGRAPPSSRCGELRARGVCVGRAGSAWGAREPAGVGSQTGTKGVPRREPGLPRSLSCKNVACGRSKRGQLGERAL